MDNLWVKVIQITGAVGVISFLIHSLINNIFKKEIADILGQDNFTYIVILISIACGIALIISVSKSDSKEKGAPAQTSKNINVKYGKKATHKGDNNF